MVIATQNPIEYEGTFPLPEAQLDRFTMRLHLGYPAPPRRPRMLSEHAAGEPLELLEPVASAAEIEAAIAAVKGVFVEDSLHRYVVAILRHTRGDARLALGASPRAGISLLRVAKALRRAARSRLRDPGRHQGRGRRRALAPRDPGGRGAHRRGRSPSDVIREAVDRTPVPV